MRKRSPYRPRPVIYDTMSYVKGGMLKLPQAVNANAILRIKNHDALAAIAQGRGVFQDADLLVAAFNMSEALVAVNTDLGLEYKPTIRAGLDAVRDMSRRGLRTGRFVCTGPELTAINAAMEVHDAQLDAATIAELEKALALVERLLAAGKGERIAEAA